MKKFTEKENLNNFYVLGVSYEKADVETRGKYAFFEHWEKDFVEKAKKEGIEHFFILSTCNRTEAYFFAQDYKEMGTLYCDYVKGDRDEFEKITFIKQGKKALNHLFRVSAGMESQILGDFEILGQIKKSFSRFKKLGCSNAYLERFINTAVQISKQIKNETSLSDGATSVSYAAVQYVINNVADFQDKNVVLFGLGKIGRNTCDNLVKHSDNNKITVVNRTRDKAEKLSHKLEVNFEPVENLTQVLQKTDILIVATGAENPTITKDMLPRKEMLIIDLTIPANVAPEVTELQGIELIDVDKLSQVISETMKARESEVPKVETIIRLSMWEFEDWIEMRQHVPVIEAFRDRMLFLTQHEKKQLLKKEAVLCEKEDQLTIRLTQKMTNQFAAFLMENPQRAGETIDLMNEIFHLEINED